MKRRIGPAWVERLPGREWRRRRGRIVDGHFDERRAYVRMAELIAEHAEQADLDPAVRDARFEDVAEAWLSHLEHSGRAKPSTIANYRLLLAHPRRCRRGDGEIEARIMRYFGGRLIGEITPAEIARFLGGLDRKGLSPRNVNGHRVVLHALFNFAMRPEGFGLKANPVALTERRREPGPGVIETFTPEELAAIERVTRKGEHLPALDPVYGEEVRFEWERCNLQDAVLFVVAAHTGLRQGELRALRWRHVDVGARRLTVEQAVSAGRIQATTKSRRIRYVPMTDLVVDRLETLAHTRQLWRPDDLVFCGMRGEILDGSALRRRFKKAQRQAGVPVRRFHDLRHTFGSMAIRTFDLVSVKEMMGHSGIATTQRYMHSRPRLDDARKLSAAFAVEPGDAAA